MVAYVLVNVFMNFGILKILQSDNKKSFMGKVMQAQYNIGRRGYHPMSMIKAGRAWDHLVMDFIGPFLMLERGYMFILIICRHAHKICHLKTSMR